jgi:hypothetical protein
MLLLGYGNLEPFHLFYSNIRGLGLKGILQGYIYTFLIIIIY